MKIKLKFFDILIFLSLVLIFAVFFMKPLKIESVSTLVTVKIPRNEVENEIEKDGEIFLNSVNEPVKIERYQVVGDHILITLEGAGLIEENRYIFNGQRVLVGQKAELHGKFWAQGIITEVKYAD